jgi:hypothetical protein
MAFNIGAIPFNRSSGVGEGLNSAATNFLRAYQMRKERQLQQREADQRERLTDIQIQNAQREAQMAPLREAMIRGAAYQQGVKPEQVASDTTFTLPTLNTLGAPVVNAPAATIAKDRRYLPLVPGQLPISDVSDASIATVRPRGGFVYDTMDNPTANARADAMAERRRALEAIYTRDALTGARQERQNEFTAGQNALNRQNQRSIAGIRHSPIGGPESQTRQAIQAQIQTLRAQAAMVPKYNSIDRQLMGSTPDGQAAIDEADRQADEIRTRLESLYQRLDSLGTEANPPAAGTSMTPHAGEPGVKPVIRGGGGAPLVPMSMAPAAERARALLQSGSGAATGQMDARQMSLARAMAIRLQAQGLSRDEIAAELRKNGFNVVP